MALEPRFAAPVYIVCFILILGRGILEHASIQRHKTSHVMRTIQSMQQDQAYGFGERASKGKSPRQ